MSGIIVWRFQQILYDQAERASTRRCARSCSSPQQSDDAVLARGLARWARCSFSFNSSNLATVELARTASCRSTRPAAIRWRRRRISARSRFRRIRSSRHARRGVSPGHDRRASVSGRGPLSAAKARTSAIIHVAEPLDTLQRTFARAREAIVIVLATTAAAVVIFSIVLASQATTPINELSREMREIGSDGSRLAAGPFDGRRRWRARAATRSAGWRRASTTCSRAWPRRSRASGSSFPTRRTNSRRRSRRSTRTRRC